MPARVKIERKELDTLANCGGYYCCPINPITGEFLGPLVGYAGKYADSDGKQKQYVGLIYANFAVAEIYPEVLRTFSARLSNSLASPIDMARVDAFCGAPIGGYSLATALSLHNHILAIKAEKKVVALATSESREKSKLVFSRHNITRGCCYVIVEDVCNNFSTTEELIKLIHSLDGEVIAIVCFLNRSLTIDNSYHSDLAGDIPVISLVRMPIAEYRQDDPYVATEVAKGNVVWKPKEEWDRLMQAVKNAK